jgi:hypothetical protein
MSIRTKNWVKFVSHPTGTMEKLREIFEDAIIN